MMGLFILQIGLDGERYKKEGLKVMFGDFGEDQGLFEGWSFK